MFTRTLAAFVLVIAGFLFGFALATNHLVNGFLLVDYQYDESHTAYLPVSWSTSGKPNDPTLLEFSRKFPPRYILERFGVPVLVIYH